MPWLKKFHQKKRDLGGGGGWNYNPKLEFRVEKGWGGWIEGFYPPNLSKIPGKCGICVLQIFGNTKFPLLTPLEEGEKIHRKTEEFKVEGKKNKGKGNFNI